MRSVLGDGIGVVSGGSASGFMSTLSKDDNLVLSSEDSSTPDESELELGLGLSLGGGCGVISEGLVKTQKGSRGQYARILTAKDFSSASYSTSSSALSSVASSSSSSSSMNKANVSAGTKRSADSVAAANGASQVVGWPPIRTYRMQSLVNSAKLPTSEYSFDEKSRCLNSMIDKNGNDKGQGHLRKNLFVKVNMDGIAIGRKVDLSAHNGYEALARTLEDMFYGSNRAASSLRMSGAATGHSRLLDGSFDFVLTYEDKDGDWMLVGDVPWGMFLDSVKRLRIMRTSDANGLSPRIQERNGSSRQPMLKR